MRTYVKIGVPIIIFAICVGCSNGSWPEADQEKFRKACKAEGGTSSYCSCFLENVINKYPNVSDADKMEFEMAVELSKDCE
jgi:hypothetical protein